MTEGSGGQPRRISRRAFFGAACGVCAAVGLGLGRGLTGVAAEGARVGPAGPTFTGSEAARRRAQPEAVFRVRTRERVVALTFDDGPDPHYTPQVLDVLARHGAPATFFLVGVNAEAFPALVATQTARGHAVGNHTFDHAELGGLPAAAVRAEVESGSAAIVRAGAPRPTLFRPPRGHTDREVGAVATAEHYRTIFWDLCLEHFVRADGVVRGTDALLSRLRPGSVILAHDGGHVEAPGRPYLDRSPTIGALPLLLEGIAARGFRVVDLPTMLDLERPRRSANR